MNINRRSLIALSGSVAGLALLGSARAADPLKVAIVMPGNITDKSWSQSGYEGILQAKEKLGVEIAYSEKVARPTRPRPWPTMRAVATSW